MSPRKLTLIRAALPVKCPSCSAEIPWRYAAVQFLCPACGQGVRLRGAYFRVLYVLSIVLISLVAYAAGIRGDALFGTVLLGILPTNFLVVFVTMRLFPPDVEATGDYRGILYGAHPGTDGQPIPEPPGSNEIENETPTSSPADLKLHGATFKEVPDHWTFEGVVLRIATILLVVFAAWMAVRPLIYRILPEFGATKSGPTGFPMTVHIGQDALRFANGSTEPWTCRAHLGFRQKDTITFAVEPQKTHDVSYVELQALADDVDVPFLRSAAREKIAIECAELSGVTHRWTFD